ncbi:MAG: peptidoglycan-binding protein, partial [Pseudomonadota bacterium]
QIRQSALQALGYYTGAIDGAYGPGTRGAVREFQRANGFDETDALSPLQTVSMICNAAESKGDAASQNALGVMYALGLGVVQNTDLALDWLRRASDQNYGEAFYNLALIYGSDRLALSYRLCDVPEDQRRARDYWRQARRLGVPQTQNTLWEERRSSLPQRGAFDDDRNDRSFAENELEDVCVNER